MGTGWDDEKRGWGYYPPYCSRTPQAEGGFWHTHIGIQDSRVLVKVPCHFLLAEGKVKDVWAPRGLSGALPD